MVVRELRVRSQELCGPPGFVTFFGDGEAEGEGEG